MTLRKLAFMAAAAARALRAVATNTRGNVAVIIAVAIIPIAAVIGSGVDMSRAYMAQQKLQQACDAGSLAGRRVMSSGTIDASVSAEATKFFNFNFPQGTFQTSAFTPQITAPDSTTVRIQAATAIPTTIMRLFGYSTLPISVDCKATQNFVNTDIMLVLDNTGSMNCTPGSTAGCSYEVYGSKMQGMRDAVMALYDQLATTQSLLASQGLRLRYGIVPYSSVVNVGKDVYALDPSYVLTSSQYQRKYTYCSRYSRNGSCRQTSTACCQAMTVSHSLSWMSSSWSGCLEARQTDRSITANSGYSIPSDAYDLDLDALPTSDATRWPVWDPSAEQANYAGSPKCQSSNVVKRLQSWTRSSLNSYMDGLRADGGTLSDIGVIWGGRLIASSGIFGADNPATYGGAKVNKFMIVMTDGAITSYGGYYGAYGVEDYDHRIEAAWPCDSSGNVCTADSAIHRQRFAMVCNAIKGENVSIWVIGFGQSFTAKATSDDTKALSGCASNASQAAYVSDSNALIAQFKTIGQNIGRLRLSQ